MAKFKYAWMQYASITTIMGLTGCSTPQPKPMADNAPIYPATVGQATTVTDISDYRSGYRFLPKPSGRPTEISFWITRDESGNFHVPWEWGGDVDIAGSEHIAVDPVAKTISLDFGVHNGKFECSRFERVDDREQYGYSPCSSIFSRFPARPPAYQPPEIPAPTPLSAFDRWRGKKEVVVTPPPAPPEPQAIVSISVDSVALAALQLNLFNTAEAIVEGEEIGSKMSAKDVYSKLKTTGRAFESDIRVKQEKIIGEYVSAAKVQPKVIAYQVIDRSGYYGYDAKWTGRVEVQPNTYKKRQFSYADIANEMQEIDTSNAIAPIANILAARMKQQYKKDVAQVTRDLAQVTRLYGVECHYPEVIGGYKVAVRCPSSTARTDSGFEIPVTVEILARKFGVIVPSYASHNSDVSVVVDGEFLSVRNNQNHSLRLRALVIDVNGTQQSIALEGREVNAVDGQLQMRVSEEFADEMKAKLNVPFVSRREAVSKILRFGVTLDYEVVLADGLPSEVRQLTQNTEYRLHDLLSAR
ncbi:MAG: hypothetical protein H7A00_01280 [Hahellaceae bacterium]|nr:hypothetical protein [Hahellaceae bacterium]